MTGKSFSLVVLAGSSISTISFFSNISGLEITKN